MKKTKVWLVAALSLTLGLAAFAACTPNDTPPGQTDTVTLDHTSYELDLHEQIRLTATAEGTVAWSSSDEGVATVKDGLVRSVAAGTAVITATSGEASAECKITVVNSMSAPVLTVSNRSVSLDKDTQFTVDASVTYKGNPPIDPVSYTWTLAEGGESYLSLTPAEDGASAVLEGLEYGETSFTVSSQLWGIPMVQTVAVRICDTSISFEVDGYTPVEGGYKTTLGLIDTDEYESSMTPEVTVFKDGEPSDLTIAWTVDDSGVVSVDDDGTISALKAGTATLTGACGGNFVKLFVEVVRPEMTLDPIVFETSVGTLHLEVTGTVERVSIDDGVNLYESYDAETKVLTLDKSVLPRASAELGPDKTIRVETDKAVYVIPADVYTQVINDAAEFANWGAVAKQAAEGPVWDGWFVLGNDIDFAGKIYEPFSTYSIFKQLNNGSDANCFDGRLYGFKGIFDGMGYCVDDIQMRCSDAGGFVGLLHQQGIIRNIAFTNAVHLGRGGFIVSAGDGRVENVYISCLLQNGGAVPDRSGFFFPRDCMGEARVVHCFVEIRSVADGAAEAYSIGSVHENYGILDGVYTVGNPNGIFTLSTGAGTPNVYGVYTDYAQLRAENVDFSAWDTDFWQIVNGIPFPAKMSVPTPSVTLKSVSAENGTVALEKQDEYLYGEAVVLNITPAQDYKLTSLIVNDKDMTASVEDGKLTLGYAYGEMQIEVQATFALDLPAYDVTFKADAKWGADGMVITMKQGDKTKTVTLGENAIVEGMDAGVWTATTQIGGMTVSLGEFNIQATEYIIDFGTIFRNSGALTGSNLQNDTFTYATGNLGSVSMDIDIDAGDAFFAATLKLDSEAVMEGKGWTSFALSFRFGDTEFCASLMYNTDPNSVDYGNSYIYMHPSWGGQTLYLPAEVSKALGEGKEAIIVWGYDASEGTMTLYSGVSADNMIEAKSLYVGQLPKDGQITGLTISDTWDGAVKSTMTVKISYGKTLADAVKSSEAEAPQS